MTMITGLKAFNCSWPWLPATVYFNRFADSNLRIVSDFDESIDVTKTTVEGGTQMASNLGLWRHRRLEGRNGWPFQDRAAVLGWNAGSRMKRGMISLTVC